MGSKSSKPSEASGRQSERESRRQQDAAGAAVLLDEREGDGSSEPERQIAVVNLGDNALVPEFNRILAAIGRDPSVNVPFFRHYTREAWLESCETRNFSAAAPVAPEEVAVIYLMSPTAPDGPQRLALRNQITLDSFRACPHFAIFLPPADQRLGAAYERNARFFSGALNARLDLGVRPFMLHSGGHIVRAFQAYLRQIQELVEQGPQLDLLPPAARGAAYDDAYDYEQLDPRHHVVEEWGVQPGMPWGVENPDGEGAAAERWDAAAATLDEDWAAPDLIFQYERPISLYTRVDVDGGSPGFYRVGRTRMSDMTTILEIQPPADIAPDPSIFSEDIVFNADCPSIVGRSFLLAALPLDEPCIVALLAQQPALRERWEPYMIDSEHESLRVAMAAIAPAQPVITVDGLAAEREARYAEVEAYLAALPPGHHWVREYKGCCCAVTKGLMRVPVVAGEHELELSAYEACKRSSLVHPITRAPLPREAVFNQTTRSRIDDFVSAVLSEKAAKETADNVEPGPALDSEPEPSDPPLPEATGGGALFLRGFLQRQERGEAEDPAVPHFGIW